MKTGKCLEFFQTPGSIEGFGVEVDSRMRRVDARATTVRFLGVAGVRRTVCAEEKFRTARGGRLDQRQPVFFAFQDRKAVIVGSDATLEDIVSIHQKMVSGNRCGHIVRCAEHKLDGIGRCDVLHYDAESGQSLYQGNHAALDKDLSAIKDINLLVCNSPAT